MEAILSQYGYNKSELSAMLDEVDEDNDQLISYDEFEAHLTPHLQPSVSPEPSPCVLEAMFSDSPKKIIEAADLAALEGSSNSGTAMGTRGRDQSLGSETERVPTRRISDVPKNQDIFDDHIERRLDTKDSTRILNRTRFGG